MFGFLVYGILIRSMRKEHAIHKFFQIVSNMEYFSGKEKMKLYFKLILFLLFMNVLIGICSISSKAELIEPTRTLEGGSKQKSRLAVFSEPPSLDVFFDGNKIGQTPVKLDEVEPGIHTLRIKDSEKKIYIAPDKSLKISFIKGSFVEILEKEKKIEKQPKKERVTRKEKLPDRNQDEIKYEPLYWPLNPKGQIF